MTTTFVASGVTSTNVSVTSGNTLEVLSGGTASATKVSSGGIQQVDAGGLASGTVISSGGVDLVFGSETQDDVRHGGLEIISSGGVATGTTGAGIRISGVLNVLSSGVLDHATVFGGGVLNVSAGGSAGGAVISNGTETVLSGGTIAGTTTIGSSGTLSLQSGALVNGGVTFVGSGGTLVISGTSIPAGLVINNFVAKDEIDLASVPYSRSGTTSVSGNVLTVSEGGQSYSISFDSLPAGVHFALLPDAGTGTRVQIGGALPQQVLSALGVTPGPNGGLGIKVGVISTSFNALGGEDSDIANGLLPPKSKIHVLHDAASDDEGRALMQVVHTIAPAAELYFYAGGNTPGDLVSAINALVIAGCNVIVDDLDDQVLDPTFQLDEVASAVTSAVSSGVVYIAAAGDSDSNAYQAPWTPISGTYGTSAGQPVTLTDAQSFGGSLVQTVTVPGTSASSAIPLTVGWDQPFDNPSTTMKVLVFSAGSDGTEHFVKSATNLPHAGGTYSVVSANLDPGTYRVAIEKVSGPDPGLIKEIIGHTLDIFEAGTISGSNAGTVRGHAMSPDAITVGAVGVFNTPAFSTGDLVNEDFSASGFGTELLFDEHGVPFTKSEVLTPVALSGIDYIATSVFPGFVGTSCAAPSIAGLVALMLQANPNLKPAEVKRILQATALAMPDPDVSGAGLVQGAAAIAAGSTTSTISGGLPSSVSSGQTSNGLIVLSGGTLNVLSGGTTSAMTIDTLGSGSVFAGGIASGTRLGGVMDIRSGGTASNTTVVDDARLEVHAGGTAVATIVEGKTGYRSGTPYFPVTISGIARVESGGTVIGTTLNSGGLLALSGGTAISTTINGGTANVLSGAIESAATINAGGTETVFSGGTITGTTTISAGGTLSLESGALVSGGVAFVSSGGTLEISGTSIPAGLVISKFVAGDKIDLASVPYDRSGTTSVAGNVLTVSEGGQSYNISFDSLSSEAHFALLPDAGSGTFVQVGGALPQQVLSALSLTSTKTGHGIKVGVISTSFNNLGGAAQDEANGLLPPASKITYVKDLPSGDGDDEGRALMQVIHTIAPDATLAFHYGGTTPEELVDAIQKLIDAHCDIIVDDVDDKVTDPMFQLDVTAKKVAEAVASGIVYIAASGDSDSNGYQAPWAPGSGTFDGVQLTDAQTFGGSLVQTVTVPGTASIPFTFGWDQPFTAPTSTMKLLVFSGGQPLDNLSATNLPHGSGTYSVVTTDLPPGTYQVAIEKVSASDPDPGLIKEVAGHSLDIGQAATITGANAGTVRGHSMSPDAITVGAVKIFNTPAFSTSGLVNEEFSASGFGTELVFDENGVPFTKSEVLTPVALSGIDDIATSVFPGFVGTSAAAPTIAGLVALMLQQAKGDNRKLTPAEVKRILEATALAMPNPDISGAGLVQGDAALAAAKATAMVSGAIPLSVSSGQTSNGLIVLSGATLNVLSGGKTSATTIDTLGSGSVFAGGIASGTRLGGVMDIRSGGIASTTTVVDDARLEVRSGGTAVATIVQGKTGYRSSTSSGYLPVTISGIARVVSGGTVISTTLNSGGLLALSGGTAISTMINGGTANVLSGAIESAAIINSGGIENVLSGGVASGATLATTGAYQLVSGKAVGTTLSGGIQVVFSGGAASATTISSGGQAGVYGVAVNTIVNSSGNLYVNSGGVGSGATVASGGVEYVFASGVISGTIVSGGIESVQSGGLAVGTVLNSGGFDVVNSGGRASGAIVNNARQDVFGGATASGTTLNNGIQVVFSGGAASATTINSGGQEGVYGSAFNTVVKSGGNLYVNSGAVGSGATVASGGVEYVFASGVISGTIVNGGIESVQPGGLAVGTVVNSNGFDVVNVGGRASGAIVNGARQDVYGGASGTTLNSAGIQVVFNGGAASATTINSGGQEGVYGVAVNAIVNSGGNLYVNSGAVGSGATVASGGVEYVFASGVISGTIVNGGIESVQPGGVAVGTILNSGGLDVVNVGGSARGATINSGTQQVLSGGVATGTTLTSAGRQIIFAGGVGSATTLGSGAQEGVYGSAMNTIINSGGVEYVWSGGFDSGAHVNSGGFEIVTAGGTVSGATISGGTLEIMSGGGLGLPPPGEATVTFALSGGGILQLDHSQSFAGTVAGFGEPDFLDLRDIVFSSATTLVFTEAPGNTSGTLTVSDGIHTANMTLLGQYVTAQFTKQSDGHGGTLVGDPPPAALTDPALIGLVVARGT